MNKTDSLNILLTSVGRRAYIVKWFQEELDGMGEVHVVNSSPLVSAFKFADYAKKSPIIYSEEYVPFLLDYCKKHSIDVVVPLFDVDIPVLAANKESFNDIGCFVLVPSEDIANVCNDKYKTFEFINRLSLFSPLTYLNFNDLYEDINSGICNYPFIVKPRWGMGSIGIMQVNKEDELEAAYNMVLSAVKDSYLIYESNNDLDSSVVIQEKIKGDEYGLDIINNLKGEFVNVVVKKKIAMRSGETDIAEIISANNDFCELARVISRNTNHPGNMDMDLIVSDNKFYVLEMNPRFGGGYPFSHLAGVNLPRAIINWFLNKDVDHSLLEPKHYGIYLKDINIVKYL